MAGILAERRRGCRVVRQAPFPCWFAGRCGIIKINAIKIVSLVIPKILNLLVKNKTTESKK